MPDPHAPLLQYADAPARHGIVFETTPEGVIVTIPVPLARRVLGMAAYGGMLVMALIIHVFVAVAMVVAGLALVVFRNRLGRPIVIELDARELRFRNVAPGEAQSDWACPRADVYDVKYVRHSGNLVVRIRGREMFEVRPSDDPAIVAWLAETLNRALWPSAAPLAAPTGGATPEKP
jgi:hypothetical protein